MREPGRASPGCRCPTPDVTSSRVSLPEAPLCFQRVCRALRAWATRQVMCAHAAPGADVGNIERDHAPLLHMLM